MSKGLFIGGQWRQGRGEELVSINPANEEVIWKGRAASQEDVHEAVVQADTAAAIWAERTFEDRKDALVEFEKQLEQNKEKLGELISRETGKPLWESAQEVGTMRT